VKVEREALQLLLTRSREAAPWAEEVRDEDFTSAYRREVYELARRAIDDPSFKADAGAASGLSPEALSMYAELTVGAADAADEDVSERLREVFVRLRVFRLEREIRSRRTTLQDVNPLVDPKGHDRLFTDLVALEAERRELLRRLQGAV
jgi:hypothetical protein